MIYKGLNRIGMIGDIKTKGGGEIAEVYGGINESSPIYYKSRTITGQTPLSYKALSKPLSDYLISGNTLQDGTPTPSDPVDVVGCGVRTENLLNYHYLFTSDYDRHSEFFNYYKLILEPNTQYTFTTNATSTDTLTTFLVGISNIMSIDNDGLFNGVAKTITSNPDGSVYIARRIAGMSYIIPENDFDNGIYYIMLNTGSTALPYEPYGYKLDISSGGRNLFDEVTAIYGKYINSSGIEMESSTGQSNHSDYIPVRGNTSYSIATTKPYYKTITSAISWYDINKTFIVRSQYSVPSTAGRFSWSVTSPSNAMFAILNFTRYPDFDGENDMLNEGSTPLPYEPYNRITNPIYLGQVPTTRRVKKLVLTGEEGWDESAQGQPANNYFRIQNFTIALPGKVFCTHYVSPNENISIYNTIEGCKIQTSASFAIVLIIRPPEWRIWSVDDFKSYLAQQYANGTPVTIWYVLATPQTAAVNEPLHKIGDYTDTISFAQTGVTIPTVSGTNTLLIDTTVQPSSVSITGNIKEVQGT